MALKPADIELIWGPKGRSNFLILGWSVEDWDEAWRAVQEPRRSDMSPDAREMKPVGLKKEPRRSDLSPKAQRLVYIVVELCHPSYQYHRTHCHNSKNFYVYEINRLTPVIIIKLGQIFVQLFRTKAVSRFVGSFLHRSLSFTIHITFHCSGHFCKRNT